MDINVIFIIAAIIICIIYSCYIWIQYSNSARLLQSIPGFCMGIGIIVTFINMYWVFNEYNAQSDLNDLIKDISKAFLGSLAGIFIGLFQTPFIKYK